MRPWFAAVPLATALLAALVPAAGPPARPGAAPVNFARDIEPILQARCVSCHGPKKQRGDLRLDRRSAAVKGGQSGPALVPGKSAASLLLRRASSSSRNERMPPSGERLTNAQLALLRDWIDQGAPWPEVAQADPRKTHWAFQPVKRPAVPDADFAGWARGPIDRFIADRLAKAALRPTPEAGRATLLRRLKFDLLGLPPTPDEVRAFAIDKRPDAYERLVDRYLASPHFGERWARHWLDVVRFAETTGFETNSARPNAWPYRDYVIAAFNDDRPYDRFVLEQIAGDAVGVGAATGYLVAGAYDQVKGDPILTAQQRADELHDLVATTGTAFLGLTAGCARCHDHKFDPVSQADYYGLKAVFAGVQHGERPLPMPGAEARRREAEAARKELPTIEAKLDAYEPLAGGDERTRPAVSPRRNVERFAPVEAKLVRMTIFATSNGIEPCIDELEVYTAGAAPRNVALASHGTTAAASGTYPNAAIHQLPFVHDGRYGNSRSWISNQNGKGWVQLTLPKVERIDRIAWGRDRLPNGFTDRVPTMYRIEVAVKPGEWRTVASSDDRAPGLNKSRRSQPPAGLSADDQEAYRKLASRRQALEARLAALASAALVYAGRFTAPEVTFRLHRGEATQPRERVAPAAPTEFGPRLQLRLDAPEQQRRVALARWVTAPSHPLTARVIVNRLWQHHFGTGLVATPSDFGLNGGRPSHPELLDYLADELVRGGWRLKAIHRAIVLSSTYRQGSAVNPEGLAADAGGRLLWRYSPRRLEAEPLRDAILTASGKLDLRMGGPGFDLFESKGNTSQGVKVFIPKKEFGPAEWRRMVYQTKPRMRLDDTFGAFDCPDAGQTAPMRTASTTALQVLNLSNSPFVLEQAALFAARLEKEAPDAAGRVRRAYWLAYGRAADADEVADGVELVRDHGLKALCRALFNTNEFLYVD